MGKNRIDIMVDLETLGTDFNAPIFQIASAAFDIEADSIITTFNEFADISKMREKGSQIDGSTLKWWLRTNKELFTELIHKGEHSEEIILYNYWKWLICLNHEYDDIYLWGNGILFDNAIIRHKLESYKFGYPIHFRNDRDVRTIFELAIHKTGETAEEMYNRIYDKKLVAHDAMNDVRNQIALVTECYRILTEER